MKRADVGLLLGLAGAAALAVLLSPKRAGASPLPEDAPVPPPTDPDDIAPPPDLPGYAPDPLLGGGWVPPGARPDPAPAPAPSGPTLGPVLPSAGGAYRLDRGGRYRADVTIDAPAFLVNEGIVAANLTAAGFTVHRCTRTAGSNFQVEATRTGAGGNLAPPERVKITRLERIG